MPAEWILSNIDRIGAYFLLLIGVYALVTGKIVTVGRLNDWIELCRLLREENKQLRETLSANNLTLDKVADAQERTNTILKEALEERQPRRGAAR
jgi:hypothetical protein